MYRRYIIKACEVVMGFADWGAEDQIGARLLHSVKSILRYLCFLGLNGICGEV